MKETTRPVWVAAALTIVCLIAASGCSSERRSPTDPGQRPASDPAALRAPAADYRYTTIDVPNATWTDVLRMNASGDAVGAYGDQSGVMHGFLLRHGNFLPIDVPGAASTEAHGINERGDIVGSYTDGAGSSHGFVSSHDGFTTVDHPGAASTMLWGISDRGDIVGEYSETAGGPARSFTWSHGEFTTLDPPSAAWSAGLGINSQGAVVGHYAEPGTEMFGYVFENGTYTKIKHPDSGNRMTCVMDINERGAAVGHFAGESGISGFVWADGEFGALVRVPDSAATIPYSITPSGVIAGLYYDANWGEHGFVAEPRH